MFSTMECNELNNAKAEAESESSFSFTQSEDSSIESGNNALEDEDDEEEVSLNELLLVGKTKKKIELLAAMVGVDTPEPAIVFITFPLLILLKFFFINSNLYMI